MKIEYRITFCSTRWTEPKSKPSVDENLCRDHILIVLEQYDVRAPISSNLFKMSQLVVIRNNHILKLVVISFTANPNEKKQAAEDEKKKWIREATHIPQRIEYFQENVVEKCN